jgi:regulator of sirC expression with transglutaminase-like and TPR domain
VFFNRLGELSLQDFTEAIRLQPDYADAFIDRGLARQAKSDVEGALQDYSEAHPPRIQTQELSG